MSTREALTHHEEAEQLHNTNFLLIVVGPTASGKTAIIRRFLERYPHVKNIVSMTTRKMRPDEKDGISFHFISEEEFLARKNTISLVTDRVIEGSTVHYGVEKSDLDRILLGKALAMHLDMETASRFQEELERLYEPAVVAHLLAKTLIVFLGSSSLLTLKERYLKRDRVHDTRQTFADRIKHEWVLWKRLRGYFPHVVMNDDTIDTTLNDIVKLLNTLE